RMMFTRMDYVHFKPAWFSNLINTLTVGRYYTEEKHPISKRLFQIYEPVCRWTLRFRKPVVIAGAVLSLWGLWNALAMLLSIQLPGTLIRGYEFMPPLYEGSLLYMPTTLPGL